MKRRWAITLALLLPAAAIGAQEKSAEIETVLTFQPNWKRENLKLVVFIQENESRKIIGVRQIRL